MKKEELDFTGEELSVIIEAMNVAIKVDGYNTAKLAVPIIDKLLMLRAGKKGVMK